MVAAFYSSPPLSLADGLCTSVLLPATVTGPCYRLSPHASGLHAQLYARRPSIGMVLHLALSQAGYGLYNSDALVALTLGAWPIVTYLYLGHVAVQLRIALGTRLRLGCGPECPNGV